MKNLKLLFLTLISVLTFNLFSQTQVYVTNTSNPGVCDGAAMLDTSNVNLTSIFWQGMGAIINQGSYMVTNLCPGTYSVTFTINGSSVTQTFTIQEGTNGCNMLNTITGTNSLDSTTCDGTINITTLGGTAPITYTWYNLGLNPTNTLTNLCPDSYCCEITDAAGCTDIQCISIEINTPTGDTLIINGGSGCSPSIGIATVELEDCTLDFNLVDTAFISLITYPLNPMDSLTAVWSVLDSTGMAIQNYTTYYSGLGFGCYDLQFILYCFQKSTNIHTIVMTSSVMINFDGIDELSTNSKQLVRVVDLMGREVKPQPNKFLIYTYSDGSKEIKYINE